MKARGHDSLSPGVAPETAEAVYAGIDWAQAPADCGGYIVVCVEHDDAVDESGQALPRVERHGCWVMHDTGKRYRAPLFPGAELVMPGQYVGVERRGHRYDGIAMLLLRIYFEREDTLNLIRDEPRESPSGKVAVPLAGWRRTPLFRGVALGLGYTRERSRRSAYDPGVRISAAG